LLALIADTLQPADFEELKKHGFGDDGPADGRPSRRRGPGPAAGRRLGEES